MFWPIRIKLTAVYSFVITKQNAQWNYVALHEASANLFPGKVVTENEFNKPAASSKAEWYVY